MMFSFFQQIASGERAACLPDQPTIANVSEIDDGTAETCE
jgi:hypothetical protein